MACESFVLGSHTGEGLGASLIDGGHTIFVHAEDIDDIPPCLIAHRDHVIRMASRSPILLAVEEAIDGLVELRVADER